MTAVKRVLVIGGSSAIARAFIDLTCSRDDTEIVAVSRNPMTFTSDQVRSVVCDYGPASIRQVIDNLREQAWIPDEVVICNGQLHGDGFGPEKQLRSFDADAWLHLMQTNTLVPMLWIQGLADLIPKTHPCTIVVFSARVGSISDNRLGGWYSYRSSKAALNMLVKTAGIEFSRTHKHIALLLFHPGTTDTPLSKPFQANVPEGKLFTPQFVAEQLSWVIEQKAVAGAVGYWDWNGQAIAW